MNAYKIIQRFHKGLSRFLNLIIRVAAEMPNKQTSDIIFEVSNKDNSELIRNTAGIRVRTV